MSIIDKLLKAINEYSGLTFDEITSRSKKEKCVYARRIIVHHMSESGFIDGVIANVIRRDRTTVLGIKKKHSDELQYNPEYKEMFDAIINLLNN